MLPRGASKVPGPVSIWCMTWCRASCIGPAHGVSQFQRVTWVRRDLYINGLRFKVLSSCAQRVIKSHRASLLCEYHFRFWVLAPSFWHVPRWGDQNRGMEDSSHDQPALQGRQKATHPKEQKVEETFVVDGFGRLWQLFACDCLGQWSLLSQHAMRFLINLAVP